MHLLDEEDDDEEEYEGAYEEVPTYEGYDPYGIIIPVAIPIHNAGSQDENNKQLTTIEGITIFFRKKNFIQATPEILRLKGNNFFII